MGTHSRRGVGSWLGRMLAALAVCGCQPGSPLESLAAGDTGLVSFESANPYDFRDLVNGDAKDRVVTVAGELVVPEGVTAEIPAMVIVHGSGGRLPRHQRYVEALTEMGIAAFSLDSFSGRGVTNTVGRQTRVTAAMMAADAYRALALLASHPRIDAERIGIMGFSKGGGVTLVTAWEPLRAGALDSDLAFALHVAFYPPCAQFEAPTMTAAPIRILIGAKDNWTPAAPCVALTRSLKAAGVDVDIVVYPNAHHAFDGSGGLRMARRGFNISGCRFVIEADGRTVEATNGVALDSPGKRHQAITGCATRGVTLGQNPRAKAQSMDFLKGFLAKRFGL